MNNKENYHRSCYHDSTTKVKRERAKDRYKDASRLSDASLVQRKAGRPSLNKLLGQEKADDLRFQGCLFNKNLCIICQERGVRLYDVEFIATDQRMLYVAEKYDDERVFYRRKNHIMSANDAVANVNYHLRCWAATKQRVAIIDKSNASQEIDAKPNVIADIEIINILQTELSDPSHKIITTNQVESRYRHLFAKHGKSYKKYLKNLVEENFKNVTFQKPPRANEPDRFCSNEAGSHALDVALKQCEAETFYDIFRVAKLIRAEIEQHTRWQFSGTFDDFNPPVYVSNLMRWILLGPNQNFSSESRDKSFEKCVSLANQFMMQSFKTKRQMSYNAVQGSQLAFASWPWDRAASNDEK